MEVPNHPPGFCSIDKGHSRDEAPFFDHKRFSKIIVNPQNASQVWFWKVEVVFLGTLKRKEGSCDRSF